MIAKSSRIAIVASAVWLLVAYVGLFAIDVFNNSEELLMAYLIFGILPVVAWNGIRWIRKSPTQP